MASSRARFLQSERITVHGVSAGRIGLGEHGFLRLRVVVPFIERSDIHRTQLPLLERMYFPLPKAAALLVVAHGEPEFDAVDAALREIPLELRHLLHKGVIFLMRAEAHHTFDARAVVPRAVEHDDLARGRQVLDVTLKVPLASFGFGRLFQRDDPRAMRIQMLHEALDCAALAGGIAPFEQDDDAFA